MQMEVINKKIEAIVKFFTTIASIFEYKELLTIKITAAKSMT